MAKENISIVPVERVVHNIMLIRGQKVILDTDLALLYGVETKVLNQAVKRNKERFPANFMFRLTKKEKDEVVTNCDHLGKLRFSPNLPCAFTEHGAIMAASVLNSQKAVEVSVFVVRAFVKLRQMLAPYKEIMKKVEQLEMELQTHDKRIIAIVNTIKFLMPPAESEPKKPFGFYSKKNTAEK